jgi:hypothetical protein
MEAFLFVAAAAVVVMVAVVVHLVRLENAANRRQNVRAAAYFATREAAYQHREDALDQLLSRH